MTPPLFHSNSASLRRDLFHTLSKAVKTNLGMRSEQSKENANHLAHTKTLILQLGDSSTSLQSRTNAAIEISQRIHEFPLESVPDIWYRANDLIAGQVPRATRRVALNLLGSCLQILLPQMDDTTRLAFYFNIMDSCLKETEKGQLLDPDLDLFMESLDILTSNGSKIEQFLNLEEDGLSLDKFLARVFEAVANGNLEKLLARTLISSLQFVTSCTRCGLSIGAGGTKSIIQIARKAFDENVLVNCLYYIDVVITKKLITDDGILMNVVQTLLNSYGINNRIRHQVNSIFVNILRSHYRDSSLRILIDLAACSEKPADVQNALNLLITLISDEEYNKHFLKDPVEPDAIGDLLTSLLNNLDSHRSFNGSNITILRSVESLISSSRFLTFMRDYPKFWKSNSDGELSIFELFNVTVSDERLGPNEKKVVLNIYRLMLKFMEENRYRDIGMDQSEDIVVFFFQKIDILDNDVAKRIVQMLHQNFDAISAISDILNHILDLCFNPSSSQEVRSSSFKLLLALFHHQVTSRRLQDDGPSKFLEQLFCELKPQQEDFIITNLAEFHYEVSKTINHAVLEELDVNFILPAFKMQNGKRRKSLVSLSNTFSSETAWSQTQLEILAKTIVKSFAWSVAFGSAQKCVHFYNMLITIAEYAIQNENTILLLIPSRILTKIGINSAGEISLVSPKEVEGISTALGRNANVDSQCNACLWKFPEEVDFIPSEFYGECNSKIKVVGNSLNDDLNAMDLRLWISLVLEILDNPSGWEIYSYLLTYMCPQISNLIALRSVSDLIESYEKLLCRHLTQGTPSKLNLPKGLYKGNLYVAFVRNLSSLLGYHGSSLKTSSDDLVSALIHALRSWEITLIPVVHILTVCCYEIPNSVKKFLTPILVQLQTRITSSLSIPTILEFMLALPDSPSIISHLTIDEFKRVFAIGFKLIQTSRDLQKKAQDENIEQNISYSELGADLSPSTVTFKISKPIAHFFLTLSYKLISSWLLRMKMEQRKELASFLNKSLILSSPNSNTLDHDTLAYLDFVSRFTLSDDDFAVTSIPNDNPHESNKHYSLGRWICGDSIVSIETETNTGKSLVTLRGLSGTSVMEVAPVTPDVPKTYDLFSFDREARSASSPYNSTGGTYSASNMFVQLCVTRSAIEKPIKIPDDKVILRSLSMFDKLPVDEFHKIGMIYMAAGQTKESEVLSNTTGSYQYHWFLSQIGKFIKLGESENSYTGGLQGGSDGEYALIWNNRRTQLAFHTTTLMPNDPNDEHFSLKKRHVGNNFVNIFYDESGSQDFDFNLIKTQFNFFNLVIKPYLVYPDDDPQISQHYKVRLYRKSGVPGLFSASHFKVLNKEDVAQYVRHVAMIANTFAFKWFTTSTPDVCTTWAARSKQLQMIRDRIGKREQENNDSSERSSTTKNSHSSDLPMLQKFDFSSYT